MYQSDDSPNIKPVIEVIRVVDGVRLKEAGPYAAASSPPPKAARGREDEHLFILLDLGDSTATHLARELREVVVQTYWATAGSVTAALRRAAFAANRYLFRLNLNADPSERRYGALTCAVLHGKDLFILLAGPGRASVHHQGRSMHFPRDEDPAYIGIGPMADVRLYHAFAALGDTSLLGSSALMRRTGRESLAQVLSREGFGEMLAGLRQMGEGADFTALVLRWREAGKAPAAAEAAKEQPLPRQERPTTVERAQPSRKPAQEEVEKAPAQQKEPGVSLGERVKGTLHYLRRGLGYLGRGISAVGAGVLAVGGWLGRAIATLFRHLLPGARPGSSRRARRRSVPDENRALMMGIAIALPVLVFVIVVLAHMHLRARARSRELIDRAEAEVALAEAAGENSEEARSHWEAALEIAETAETSRAEAPPAATIQARAHEALDRLDQIVRLTPTQLFDFGSSSVKRRLVVHHRTVFVLDREDDWVARVRLNQDGDVSVDEEGPLVGKGDQIDGKGVGDLVDCVWVDRGSGRQTSALLILEEDGALLSYSPAWQGEDEQPQVTRSALGTPPSEDARAIGSYEGRFYVLDAGAEEKGQIWRYLPQGDEYPGQPEHYFTAPPPRALAEARDMAIDGYIYVLYADGAILKFLGGEPESFDAQGIPGGLGQSVAFAVDPDGSGIVYVADRANDRVIVLSPEGAFRNQLRAEGAFDGLEALAVDEAQGRLYALSEGRLYMASLP